VVVRVPAAGVQAVCSHMACCVLHRGRRKISALSWMDLSLHFVFLWAWRPRNFCSSNVQVRGALDLLLAVR
jgi:hypothetical protein